MRRRFAALREVAGASFGRPTVEGAIRAVFASIVAFMGVMLGWMLLALTVGYVGYMGMSVLLWCVLWVVIYRGHRPTNDTHDFPTPVSTESRRLDYGALEKAMWPDLDDA